MSELAPKDDSTIRVVGFGGSLRSNSITSLSLGKVLYECELLGASTELFGADALNFPLYDPDAQSRGPKAQAFIKALRAADAVVIASPCYHSTISGLVKNAIDHIQEMVQDPKVYLSDRPIGLISVGAGLQGAAFGLGAMRNVAHALRGWPTPLGITVNASTQPFDASGTCTDERLAGQFQTMAGEVCKAAHRLKQQG